MDGSLRITDELPKAPDVCKLYEAVGWVSYTQNMPSLMRGLEGSSYLRCVYDHEHLVAIIRCVSDGATIAYLQDLLVDPRYQRRGIGRSLCTDALEHHAHCRQFVLITDDRPEQTAFYESLSLVRLDKAQSTRLFAFARMPGLT